MYLYILKFDKIEAIKIGIANGSSRIETHMRNYHDVGVNLSESYKVVAKNPKDIRLLEKQILGDYRDSKIKLDCLDGRDGYTEIRKLNILDSILSDIEYKSTRFPQKGISIIKGINNINKKRTIKKTKNWAEKKEYSNKKNIETLQMWLDIIGMYLDDISDVHVQEDKIEIIFSNISHEEYDHITSELLCFTFHSKKNSIENCNLLSYLYSEDGGFDGFSIVVNFNMGTKDQDALNLLDRCKTNLINLLFNNKINEVTLDEQFINKSTQ